MAADPFQARPVRKMKQATVPASAETNCAESVGLKVRRRGLMLGKVEQAVDDPALQQGNG